MPTEDEMTADSSKPISDEDRADLCEHARQRIEGWMWAMTPKTATWVLALDARLAAAEAALAGEVVTEGMVELACDRIVAEGPADVTWTDRNYLRWLVRTVAAALKAKR